MRRVKADRSGLASIFAAVLGVALVGATLLSPAATNVARAQTEPATAANGVLLPPLEFDPAAARIEDLAETAVDPEASTAPAPAADTSTATAAPEGATDATEATADDPEAGADAPTDGSATTTSLGGSDVAVSSVGGSHEVDRPKKRSDRKR